MQLQAIASRPIAGNLGEETNSCLTTASFQVVVEIYKVPPESPLLQTKHGPNTAVVSAVLRYKRQAQKLPEVTDLDTCVLVWDLHLCDHTPSGNGFHVSGNHG